MNKHTKKRLRHMTEIYGQDKINDILHSIVEQGKVTLDKYTQDLGRMLAQAIMLIEQEEIAGPGYHPKSPSIRKWGSQQGSVFIEGAKQRVQRPRLRGAAGEMALKSYEAMQKRNTMSESLLLSSLSGLSGRQYKATLLNAANRFGVSASSVSNHIIEATSEKLKVFTERRLNESAANSLLEAFEDLLTLHRLNASALLRRSLHSTNIIESTFARVRDCESNIKRYQNDKMSHRWLAAALLHCEKTFHRLEGYNDLAALKQSIEICHNEIDKEAN